MLALVRPGYSLADRLFPPVERLFAPDATGIGARVLALAADPFRPFPSRRPARRLASLLWLHRAALEAETQGRWTRADFFWQHVQNGLAALRGNKINNVPDGLAAALAALMREKIPGVGEDEIAAVQSRWIDEVFIDAHAGFFNGRAQRLGADLLPEDRAFGHLSRLKALLPYSGMSAAAGAALLRPARQYLVETCRRHKLWPQGIAAARALFGAEPDDPAKQEEYVGMVFHGALNLLETGDSEPSNLRQAKTLDEAIGALEEVRPQMPSSVDFHDALSQLHYMRAVRLANGRRLSQALLSVQKALTIRPSFADAEKARGQLIEMMNSLQDRIAHLDADMRLNPNMTLNAEGYLMKGESRAGFGPMNQFKDSAEAGTLAKSAQAARDRALWRNIGLPVPSNASYWDESAAALFDGLVAVASSQPADRPAIAAAWQAVAGGEETKGFAQGGEKGFVAGPAALASLDAGKVVAFLAHRLLDEAWEPAAAPPATAKAPAAATDAPPLITTGNAGRPRAGGVPFHCWFYSKEDLGAKFRWVAAAALAVFALFLYVRESREHARRDHAYAALSAASSAQDDRAVLAAAEQFLSAHPFADDPREAEVMTAYRQALVKWFAGLREVTPADAAVAARFRQFNDNAAQHDFL